jgi:polyisoprenyl-teichoic acid--peptidoglycan teichoic acid transferase
VSVLADFVGLTRWDVDSATACPTYEERPLTDSTEADKPAPKRRRILPMVLIGVAVLLVGAIGAGAFYLVSIDQSITKNIKRSDTLPGDTDPSASPRPSKDPSATGTLNYVLLGSDSRDPGDDGNGRSDSIMVVHLNKARTKAYIISFPRDMWVTVPGYGKNKINAAFAFGGAKLTVRTLEDLTGVRMDHVVLVDFEGFIQLTKDLGGVTVPNKTSFTSHGFDYPKGDISISGEKALWFVRERHSLPGGDLARAENQRNVIKAIVEKGLSAKVVSDPAKFTAFISGVSKHLVVDESLSDAEIRDTALSLRLNAKDIELLQAPLSGFGMINGQSVDIVNAARLAEMSTAIKNDKLADYVKKYPQG